MSSNFSIIERIKYDRQLTRQDILDIVESLEDAKDQSFKLECHKEDSIAWEQLGFARDLLDSIVDIITKETRSSKAIKQAILTAISDSMFER